MRELKVTRSYAIDHDDLPEDVYEFEAHLLEDGAKIGYIAGLFVPYDVEPLQICDALSQDYTDVAAGLHRLQTSDYYFRNFGHDIQTFNVTILNRLWVNPSRRKQGIGSALLQKFLGTQDTDMYSLFVLNASCFEMKARERGRKDAESKLMTWYERSGFRRVSRRCNTMIMFPSYQPAAQLVDCGYTYTSNKPWRQT